MNILQVTNFFKPSWEAGGPARVSYEISKNLVSKGHNVTVYTSDGFKSKLNVEKNKPVNIDGIKVYYFKNLSAYFSQKMIFPVLYYLPIIARKNIQNFDIIHIHEHRTFLAVVIHYYAKKYNIPYVIHAHGSVLPFFQKQNLKKTFDFTVGNKILKDASKVIALTYVEREQFVKMRVDENKIEIIPNGIDFSMYENLPDPGSFKRKYGINNDERVVLYLGRINRIKGIDLLVEAFSDLANKIENIKLVIAGPDDGFLSSLKVQIENLKIEDKTIFTGPLYEVEKLEAYVAANVYVLPSVYEAFPVTVLEACACGIPVIVTDRCGIADIVSGRIGFVVRYDKYALQDTIFKVLCDEKVRKEFGLIHRDVIKEEFNWNDLVDQLEFIYKTIVVRGYRSGTN